MGVQLGVEIQEHEADSKAAADGRSRLLQIAIDVNIAFVAIAASRSIAPLSRMYSARDALLAAVGTKAASVAGLCETVANKLQEQSQMHVEPLLATTGKSLVDGVYEEFDRRSVHVLENWTPESIAASFFPESTDTSSLERLVVMDVKFPCLAVQVAWQHDSKAAAHKYQGRHILLQLRLLAARAKLQLQQMPIEAEVASMAKCSIDRRAVAAYEQAGLLLEQATEWLGTDYSAVEDADKKDEELDALVAPLTDAHSFWKECAKSLAARRDLFLEIGAMQLLSILPEWRSAVESGALQLSKAKLC